MKFDDLTLGDMFTFSIHSKEVWEKVSSIHCVLLNYPDEEVDEVYSVNQTVYACDVVKVRG